MARADRSGRTVVDVAAASDMGLARHLLMECNLKPSNALAKAIRLVDASIAEVSREGRSRSVNTYVGFCCVFGVHALALSFRLRLSLPPFDELGDWPSRSVYCSAQAENSSSWVTGFTKSSTGKLQQPPVLSFHNRNKSFAATFGRLVATHPCSVSAFPDELMSFSLVKPLFFLESRQHVSCGPGCCPTTKRSQEGMNALRYGSGSGAKLLKCSVRAPANDQPR